MRFGGHLTSTGVFQVAKAILPQCCLTAEWLAVTVTTMESNIAARRRYSDQRERRTPPHIALRTLRLALKHYDPDGQWDLDDVCERVEAVTGDRPARGTMSAIESGTRGVSVELLSALEQAYRLPAGSITTDYSPRNTPALSEQVAS